ncbi:hypothetical protein FA95DRAFT_267420 [Auriscalpium vulgare]|uniref:Uncharacterized protein n=1 Tax=Auriscalpium vulgare TaxID=40419 RepID=A0ACB8RJX1_9AGAM|nr:hypothetical protein FA95DRAFT_267420 [Auriscalpium vulgare]
MMLQCQVRLGEIYAVRVVASSGVGGLRTGDLSAQSSRRKLAFSRRTHCVELPLTSRKAGENDAYLPVAQPLDARYFRPSQRKASGTNCMRWMQLRETKSSRRSRRASTSCRARGCSAAYSLRRSDWAHSTRTRTEWRELSGRGMYAPNRIGRLMRIYPSGCGRRTVVAGVGGR